MSFLLVGGAVEAIRARASGRMFCVYVCVRCVLLVGHVATV